MYASSKASARSMSRAPATCAAPQGTAGGSEDAYKFAYVGHPRAASSHRPARGDPALLLELRRRGETGEVWRFLSLSYRLPYPPELTETPGAAAAAKAAAAAAADLATAAAAAGAGTGIAPPDSAHCMHSQLPAPRQQEFTLFSMGAARSVLALVNDPGQRRHATDDLELPEPPEEERQANCVVGARGDGSGQADGADAVLRDTADWDCLAVAPCAAGCFHAAPKLRVTRNPRPCTLPFRAFLR